MRVELISKRFVGRIFLTVAAMLFTVAVSAQNYVPQANHRLAKTINTEWTFNYLPDEEEVKGVYELPTFDDSAWSCIAVPHTWQTYETTRELHPYIRNAAASDNPYWWNGWGWYRKRIVIGEEYRDRRICFEFDGVQKYSKVYLNGKYLGDHKGGFTSFYVDATDAVEFGKENVLVVAVQNALNDKYRIPPMNAGNWVVYGGIVRDVRLVITDRVSVPFQGSYKHEGGTFITAPEVSARQASVRIRTYVGNQRPEAAAVTLQTVVTDADGQIVKRLESSKSIEPGTIAEFDQSIPRLRNPKLWSPDSPYIYHAYSEIYVGRELVDVYHSTFGIRSISWDYDIHRLILNGKVTHLHGINRHEEFPWLGAAFPKWIAQRDMEDMKFGLDINYMRTAHYPNDPSVYEFMDRHGICINEELPNIKNQNFSKEVQEQNCREMIRRDRNHPSIIIWSMGNETDHACDSRYAAEEDPTRIITVRQPYNDSYNPEFCKHTDKEMPVESYLRCTIRGWYDKDDMNLEPSDGQWAGTDYWQHLRSRSSKNPISEHNGTVWLYADHGADREYVNSPLKHVNPKGWVDSWRTPKYVYYLWQANFSRKPMVHIQPHFWRSQYVGQKKMITVDSNCAKVELWVNGRKIGEKRPNVDNNFCVEFPDVTIEQGVIEAVATHRNGTVVKDRVVMAGEPAALTIRVSADRMMSTPDNIVEFKVDIVDKDSVHVYGANNTLKFHVEGPATLVGPDVYISDRNKHEEYEGTMYIDAPVINLIRATGETGTVTITASATGLRSASATVEVVDYVDPSPLPGISEPRLNREGRKPVAINLSQANFVPAPEEMKQFAGEVSFPIAQQAEFRTLADAFVREQNPGIDVSTPEFRYMLDAFAAILASTAHYTGERGYIVADDYNFIANQYNVSRAITKRLASRNLPEGYVRYMTNYYAKMIVRDGKDMNYLAVCDLIDRIPEGGEAVWVGAESPSADMKAVDDTDLKTLLAKVCPQIEKLDKDAKKRAYKLVTALNPSIKYKSIRDKKTKVRTDSYTIGRNSVVLIPDFKALTTKKFPDNKKL